MCSSDLPGPVAQTFFMDDEVQGKTTIDGIITLVDAKHVMLHWDSHEVQEQIAFADVLLLGQLSDIAIVATMRDVSRMPQVTSAVDRLRSVGIRVLGTVVNGATDSAPRRLYASPAPA